jgi:hypothetical protein
MAFATAQDVAARLGRDITEAEETMADLLLDGATAIIAVECGRDDEWADELHPVPGVLKIVCVEVAARSMTNPQGLKQLQERLGQYQHQTTYRDIIEGGGLMLTKAEELLVRRAVYGTTTASPRVSSWLDDIYCFGS